MAARLISFSTLVGLALWSLEVYAKTRSLTSRPTAQRLHRRDGYDYHPIPPGIVASYESRGSTVTGSTGDYIINGLSGIVDLATKEYGLRDSESFYWGINGNPNANLTAYADGEEVKVLSLERFPDVLAAADCSSNDTIKLTFTQEVQFDQVQSEWSWVNQATDNYIVLVTDSAQCNVADGDDIQRQPWHVTHATFDDTNNIVTFAAQAKRWEDAFGDWHLKLSTRGLLPPNGNQTLTRRGSPNASVDLEHDFSGHSADLGVKGETVAAGINVQCIDCRTYGSLDFVIEASKTELLLGQLGRFEVSTKGVRLDALFATTLAVSANAGAFEAELVAFTPTGFTLLGMKDSPFSFGPKIALAATANIAKISAAVIVETGVTATLPDSNFSAVVGIESSHTSAGWDPQFSFSDPVFSESVSLSSTIGLKLKVALVGTIFNIGAEADLVLAAPLLSMDATAIAQEAACGDSNAEFGIDLSVDLGMSVYAEEAVSVFVQPKPLTQTIFTTNTPLASTCIPITASTGNPAIGNGSLPGTYSWPPPGPTPVDGAAAATGAPWPGNSTAGQASCPVDGKLVCNGARQWGLCNFGKVIWQPVAQGTGCQDGQIVGTGIYALPSPTALLSSSQLAPSTTIGAPVPTGTACSVNGALLCNGETQYGLCNWGNVQWQPVAAGTACRNGAITWASRRR